MRYFKKITAVIIFILPFILGTAGYYIENESILDSMYGAFALYMVNPVFDCTNALIEPARWLGPLVLAGGLVLIVRRALCMLKDFFQSLFPDAAVIFCDSDAGEILAKNIPHAIVENGTRIRDVDDYIIMFSDDGDSLRFYEENKDKFRKKNVFIKSEMLDSFRTGAYGVRFFNINEIIARRYWKERDLTGYYDDNGGMNVKTAIVGFGQLGQKLLTYGIQNNIYSLSQSIEYHIWGGSALYQNMHGDLDLMNGDKIIYHDGDWRADINLISRMDRVIAAEPNAELALCLCELNCAADCYDPDNTIERLCGSAVYTFGGRGGVLTEENIKTDNLYDLAKRLNYEFLCIYGGADRNAPDLAERIDAEWKKLDSFTKGSNITAADYHDIRLKIMKRFGADGLDDGFAEMEHIRWCRYHYMNHWKPGAGADGKKDAAAKLHPCLVPFSKLSRADKDKDTELIKILLGLKSR